MDNIHNGLKMIKKIKTNKFYAKKFFFGKIRRE